MLVDASVFLTENQLAARQQRSVKTIRNQRVTGGGIPFVKMGRSVRYRLTDIIEWEAARTADNTTHAGLMTERSDETR